MQPWSWLHGPERDIKGVGGDLTATSEQKPVSVESLVLNRGIPRFSWYIWYYWSLSWRVALSPWQWLKTSVMVDLFSRENGSHRPEFTLAMCCGFTLTSIQAIHSYFHFFLYDLHIFQKIRFPGILDLIVIRFHRHRRNQRKHNRKHKHWDNQCTDYLFRLIIKKTLWSLQLLRPDLSLLNTDASAVIIPYYRAESYS